jgi:hypothetical protein
MVAFIAVYKVQLPLFANVRLYKFGQKPKPCGEGAKIKQRIVFGSQCGVVFQRAVFQLEQLPLDPTFQIV